MITVLIILLAVRLVIAVQLTRVSLRRKLPNLMWLAAFFYITCIGDFFFDVVRVYWLFGLFIGLGEIAMVVFIQQTFYRSRKSPWPVFMAIAAIYAVVDVYLPVTATGLVYFSPFNWAWLIVVGIQAYKEIAADKNVEDWVKGRYRLIVAYSILSLAAPIQSAIIIGSYIAGTIKTLFYEPSFQGYIYFVFAATVTGVVLEYLAWVMPKPYQRYLNRNYKGASADEVAGASMSEEEVLRQLEKK